MIEVTLSINGRIIEQIQATNRGPYKQDERLTLYTWASTNGPAGLLAHPRPTGAASLGSALLMDRATRKEGDLAVFVMTAVDAEDTETHHLERLYDMEEAASATATSEEGPTDG